MIDQLETSSSLSVTLAAREFLRETGRWAKFLSILGFVFIGLMVVLALFSGAIFSALGTQAGMPLSGAVLGGIYIGFAILYFFPVYYLFQFSQKVKQAIAHQSSELLEQSLENLKSHYKFVGIMMAIIIGLYAIGILFALLGLAMM